MFGDFAISEPDGLAMLPIATALGLVIVAVANWRQRQFFGKPYFLLSHIAMLIWVSAVSMELLSQTPEAKYFWAVMAWPGIALLPLAWASFIFHYAFSLPRTPRRAEILVFLLVPLAITLLAATNARHGLFYTSMTPMFTEGGRLYVRYEHGPLFHAVALMFYGVLGGTFSLLIWGAFRVAAQFRLYFVYPALMMTVLLVPNIAHLGFGVTFQGFDPTPFFFTLVVVLFSLLIVTNRVFDIVNVASDLIFANLRSPALIIDAHGQVAAANPAARLIFPAVAQGPCALSALLPLEPALMRSSEGLRAVPGRRIMASDRFFDVDAFPIEKPLSRQREPIGTVLLLNDVTVEEQRYRELEAELASNMRQLENSTALQAALREAAEFDPLTRVRNRLSLPQLFSHCIESAGREQRRVVLALFDIDHFKRWNDQYGHAAGDRVLRDFARFLEDQTRPVEPVFRIGGEEFLVMFPDAGLEAAGKRVDAMRAALAAAGFQRPGDTQALTFSAGLAQWPEDGATLEAVLEAADRRLYAAKSAGRNRVSAA